MSLKTVSLAIIVAVTFMGCQEDVDPELISNDQIEISLRSSSSMTIAAKPSPINLGNIVKINSKILEEPRELWVYVPESATEPEYKDFKYPIIYLLDGYSNFHSVASLARQMSSWGGTSHIPEMIVVGIPNTDRLRDLTPTQTMGTSGGGKEFISFIETELIPYMEFNYPSSGHRTFIGHSLGGLMVIDTLLKKPELFENYVAIDPSLWWDDQLVVEHAKSLLTKPNYEDKSLYLAVANTMLGLSTINEVRNDQDERTQHIRSILEFATLAEEHSNSGLKFAWKYYDDERHVTLPLIAEYDSMRFFFDWFSWTELAEIIVTDTSTPGEQLVSSISTHYERISSKLGHEYLPLQRTVNAWGQEFLREDRPDVAYAFFQLNLENYPNSAPVYESLGDYYVEVSEINLAHRNYSRALELGGSENINDKLNSLTGQ